MEFIQIKELAVRQYNLDTDDLPDVEPDIAGYVNDGYNLVNLKYYKPWRKEEIMVEDNFIPFSTLSTKPIGLVRVPGAQSFGRFNEVDQQIDLFSTYKAPTLITVWYYYLPRPMEDDDEIPKVPEWVHPYIGDYATYLLYRNGNSSKQNRGQEFLARFLDAMRLLKPYGYNMLGQDRFHGLYTPNYMV